jgi:hypothetical protein
VTDIPILAKNTSQIAMTQENSAGSPDTYQGALFSEMSIERSDL